MQLRNQFHRWIRNGTRLGFIPSITAEKTQTSSESSDDEAVAYADNPLADAKRTARYQGEVKAVF